LQIDELMRLLSTARLVLLLCHQNADPDAICSAYAMSFLMGKLRPEMGVEISAAEGPSRLSKRLLHKIPVDLVDQPRFERADAVVLLDTNTLKQLGDWEQTVGSLGKPIIFIDHHAPHPDSLAVASLSVVDEGASSTCEVVYRLFKEARVVPSETVSFALFLGVVFDTRHFVIAKSSTFKAAAELLDAGFSVEDALSLLTLPMDPSERIARVKAAQRTELKEVGGWLVGYSKIGSYQASAARALLALGVHVAVVGGEAKGMVRISLRSTKEFYEGTGFHLGRDVAKPLGEFVHGMGGGHSTSAGVNGKGGLSAAFEKCHSLLQSRIPPRK